MKVYDWILDTIGNTPLVELHNLEKIWFKSKIYAKVEFLNPGGSVKDRVANMMIELARWEENVGKTIVVLLPDTGERYLSTAMFQEN